MRSASGNRIAGVDGGGLSCTDLTGEHGALSCLGGDEGALSCFNMDCELDEVVLFSLSGWRANSKALSFDFVCAEG